MTTQLIHLYRPVGRQSYRDGWAHLNPSEYVCSVKATAPEVVRERDWDEPSDGGAYVQYARIPAGASKRDKRHILDAIRALGGSGCRHEYDCCGCRSTHFRAKFISSRQVRIEFSVSFNY